MVAFHLIFVLSLLNLFIFEITQNYGVILFKVIRRKHVRKVSQFFTCKHKINESNAKVPTHYWIICLYLKHVSYYVFIPDKFFNLFRNMFNTKTIEINNFTSVTKWSNLARTNVWILIKVYHISPILVLIKLLYFKFCQRMRRHKNPSSYNSFSFFISRTSS